MTAALMIRQIPLQCADSGVSRNHSLVRKKKQLCLGFTFGTPPQLSEENECPLKKKIKTCQDAAAEVPQQQQWQTADSHKSNPAAGQMENVP